MRVTLSPDEVAFLSSATFVPATLAQQLKWASPTFAKRFDIEIPDKEADLFRDILGEQLQLVGFDESYNPTSQGLLLEQLIDKFFVG